MARAGGPEGPQEDREAVVQGSSNKKINARLTVLLRSNPSMLKIILQGERRQEKGRAFCMLHLQEILENASYCMVTIGRGWEMVTRNPR